jgi:hypothetical protein
VYEKQLAELPTSEDDELILTAEFTGAPPAELSSDRLVLKAHFPGRTYGVVRYDLVEFFADGPTYRALGLLVFAAVFHRARTVVHLVGDDRGTTGSPITELVVDASRDTADPLPGELFSVPTSFGYWPAAIEGLHPLYRERSRRIRSLPRILWTNAEDMVITERDWQTRSVVRGFGEAEAAARLAALLLDFGRSASAYTRIDLEGPAGFESVDADSAEVRFWLGYDYAE